MSAVYVVLLADTDARSAAPPKLTPRAYAEVAPAGAVFHCRDVMGTSGTAPS